MSLYGNVKKVASSTFQFDIVYPTRVAMEANCKTDGVYAGRYVLINYGTNGIRYDTNGQETQEYTDNANTDLTKFGAVYDSTVWQKIYSLGESGEKYVMVAELNALAPKLELVTESPLVYKHTNSDHPDADEIYALNTTNPKNISQLSNTYEELKQPEFDLVHSNELAYYLHMPKPINVNLANENINYHESGFDQVYAVPTDPNSTENNEDSFIAWTTDGLVPTDVQSGNTKTADGKSLHINLPSFGNLMEDLYNLIYGVPENTPPYVRPFFKPYWEEAGNIGADPANNIEGVLRTAENDDRDWLSEVPGVGEILANNTEGLMGVLTDLFGTRDPLTGIIRYYLRTDWNSTYDYDTNAPYIENKPKTVGYTYYTLVPTGTSYVNTKTYYTLDDTTGKYIVYQYSNNSNWSTDLTNKKIYQQANSVCDYKIEYTGWTLQAVV